MILQWTVVTTAAINMFNDLCAGAYNQQGSKDKEWGAKKKHEVKITTSLILDLFPLHRNILIHHLPVRGMIK
jgi:hypothetical protein